MKYSFVAIILISVTLCFSGCNKQQGCPGVKAYTQGGGVKSKNKGHAIRNKKFQAKKGKGNDPWTKKTQKKDDKKATSGLFDKKTKRRSKEVD